MPNKLESSASEDLDELEAKMQKVSLGVSLVAVSLMIGGLADMLLSGTPLSLPGGSVLPVSTLLHLSRAPVSLAAMSAGILLLALLPAARVLLALVLYTRQRATLMNSLAALVVLTELLMSLRAGG